MEKINRILAFYILALTLLFASVVTSLVLTDRVAVELADDAEHINNSGRQRMLSQRIIYLAYDLAVEPRPETRAALQATLAEFETALDLFERSHDSLSRWQDMDERLFEIYFSDADGPSLDARVRDYIALGRRIAEDPGDADSLAALKMIERGGLLRDLDSAVARIEELSIENVTWIRRAEFYALVVAAFIVVLEIAFVFLPGHRIIKRGVRTLAKRNDDLAASHAALDRQNDELAAQGEVLEREQKRLQEALEASKTLQREQAAFTYAVSHDLKSPANSLAMLLGEIEYLLGENVNDEVREMLDQSHLTVERMSTLVEDVLAYAWSADMREEARSVDMADVMTTVRDNLDAEIRMTGATVNFGEMFHVVGYPRQLEMLVQNLVANAIKYCPDDRSPEVSVTMKVEESGVPVLRVADKSAGIPEEHLDRVFGMFQRLHRHDQVSGSGLGLSTCQRIAANHGGQISVRSTLGEGSTFEVKLASPAEEERLAA